MLGICAIVATLACLWCGVGAGISLGRIDDSTAHRWFLAGMTVIVLNGVAQLWR